MSDLVSIIVPVYNAEKYLNKCLDSIVNQTYSNLEIILINDGSTDNSLSICNDYTNKDGRIIVIDKHNTGAADSRNEGLKKATGKYIMFVDSDDFIDLNIIEKKLTMLVGFDDTIAMCKMGVCFSLDHIQKQEENLLKTTYGNNAIKNSIIYRYFYPTSKNEKLAGSACRMLIPRKIITDNNIKFKNLRFREDAIFCIELLLKTNNVLVLDEALYFYHLNQRSVSRDIRVEHLTEFVNYLICLNDTLLLGNFDQKKQKNILNSQKQMVINIFFRTIFNANLKYHQKIKLLNHYLSKDIFANYKSIEARGTKGEKQLFYLVKTKMYFIINFYYWLKNRCFKRQGFGF